MAEIDLHPTLVDLEATELRTYRPLSIAAVVGLVLGLLSPLALLHPVLWVLPWAAILVNVYALWSIGQIGAMLGRSAAVAGLGLSLLFGTLAPARVVTYDHLAHAEAQAVAFEWFGHLRQGEPHQAHQLTLDPAKRLPEQSLWQAYRSDLTLRQGLEQYVEQKLIRTLLALGERAEVRYYATERSAGDSKLDLIEDVYAVTYDEGSGKKTFFVRLELLRERQPEAGAAGWKIGSSDGGYRPKSWTAGQ